MSRLYPRIPRGLFEAIWNAIEQDADIGSLATLADTSHPLATYAQTGGQRVSSEELQHFRDAVVEIAAHYGYPNEGNQASRAAFDTDCAIWLAGTAEIPLGEALRPPIWSFIGGVLLPDVCRWRFGDKPRRERFEGGARNTFQRLWRRGFLLDRGLDAEQRWELVHALTEDAFVAICERPGLSADPRFARAIGEGWIRAADQVGKERMEGINRAAIKNLRALYTVIHPEVLDDAEMRGLVDEAYRHATI